MAVYFELALAQREQKKYAEAEATLREAETQNPPREQLQDALGWLFVWQERFPEAEAAFRAAIEADPKSLSAHCGLARTFELQGRAADAVEWWGATLRLDPQHGWAREARGWNLRALKRFEESEVELREAIRQYPDLAGDHAGLGLVLIDQGKLPEGIASLEKSLRLAQTLAFLATWASRSSHTVNQTQRSPRSARWFDCNPTRSMAGTRWRRSFSIRTSRMKPTWRSRGR